MSLIPGLSIDFDSDKNLFDNTILNLAQQVTDFATGSALEKGWIVTGIKCHEHEPLTRRSAVFVSLGVSMSGGGTLNGVVHGAGEYLIRVSSVRQEVGERAGAGLKAMFAAMLTSGAKHWVGATALWDSETQGRMNFDFCMSITLAYVSRFQSTIEAISDVHLH
jgi:hypothetical protein